MKRKILALTLAAMAIFGLTGCTNVSNPQAKINSPSTKLVDFEVVDTNYYGAILVDRNTNVMYFWSMSRNGGITPIYNEDGSLKLYEE